MRYTMIAFPGRISMKRLYVGNLNFSTTEDDIRSTFGTHGKVKGTAGGFFASRPAKLPARGGNPWTPKPSGSYAAFWRLFCSSST